MVLNIKDFPDDLHREAKIQAAILGISLKELIIQAVRDFLKKQKKRGDIDLENGFLWIRRSYRRGLFTLPQKVKSRNLLRLRLILSNGAEGRT